MYKISEMAYRVFGKFNKNHVEKDENTNSYSNWVKGITAQENNGLVK
jgi:hypothetical protein